MEKLNIVKIGGNIIDDDEQLTSFLQDFSKLEGYKILVHGGGKLATGIANSLGVKQTMVDGRRITDAETLKIIVMVYAGWINKKIVAKLQALGCNAMGFCGADGNLVKSKKRENSSVDFGFVGDVLADGVNDAELTRQLYAGLIPVFSPVTYNQEGDLLNTNADTLAARIAEAMSDTFDTSLHYCFEKNGVLFDPDNEESVLESITRDQYSYLKNSGAIHNGMIPKLDEAFGALEHGVKTVIIGHASKLTDQIMSGTTIKL